MTLPLSKDRLKELIEESRRKVAERASAEGATEATAVRTAEEVVAERIEDADTTAFTWNKEQLAAIELARKGKSFCLIGAAGTGKTTTEKEITRILIEEDIVEPLSMSTKYLAAGTPGILITSFTRRAVRASRRMMSDDLKNNCVTTHKALEFEPVFYEVWDQEAQEMRKTMRFEPQRNKRNPLPSSLHAIVIDESPMLSVDLFKQLWDALADPNKMFIFVGDLHQLPPVYGQGILGFKLLELPVVELTQIYRQAKNSPIISLAHKVKNGEDIPVVEKSTVETSQGKVTIHPWKKAISDFDATHTASIFLKKLITEGHFDEEEDIILCPQEKTKNLAFGTNEFNRIIAQTLGEQRKAVVFEIIAGYNKFYYAVGDRILVGREDAIITKITKNAKYWGKRFKPASIELDRWGNYKSKPTDISNKGDNDVDDFDMDKYLENFTLEADKSDEDRKQESSHIIEVELLDSGVTEAIGTAGELNVTQFAYAITVHKSQGSEWKRVFFFTHQSHVTMWSRELLYTAITRAREELYLIVEPDRGGKSGTLTKAARSPRIKGNTLAEKAEYFKGKKEDYEEKMRKGEGEETGQARTGIYKGQKTPNPVLSKAPEKPPVKLVRLCEYVSKVFRREAQETLDALWARAEIIWGAGKIGTKPTLDYNLQNSRIIGLASYGDNKIYLNPLWCIVADENAAILKEMLKDTLPHEVAHFINQHYSVPKGKGHDGGWVMAAKLLGMVNPTETTSEFPSWAENYRLVAAAKMAELGKEKDGVVANTDNYDLLPYNSEA